MQNHSQLQTLRAVLAQHQGKGFSELEATNILRQLLPQVDYLHQHNQVHGQISLDTIIKNNHQVILTATPTPQPANQINIQQDIYALGVVIIELLTGKVANSLRNADGSWNWEDDCFVSDQFADVINRMIGNSAQGRLNSANKTLKLLNQLLPEIHNSSTSQPISQNQSTIISKTTTKSVKSEKRIRKLSQLDQALIIIASALITSLGGFFTYKTFVHQPILFNVTNQRNIKLWKNIQLVKTLSEHSGSVNSIAIANDSQTLVSGSDDGRVLIWNLSTGKAIETISGRLVWTNLGTGEALKTMIVASDDPPPAVYSVAINEQTLISSSNEQTNIWNLKTGQWLYTLDHYSSNSLAISPDNQKFITNKQVWNLGTGQVLCKLEDSDCNKTRVSGIVIYRNGDILDSNGIEEGRRQRAEGRRFNLEGDSNPS